MTMHKKEIRLAAASAALVLAVLPARAEVLTFDGNICGGTCGNFSQFDQSYGDIAGKLDVIYDRNVGVNNYSGTAASSLSYWDAYSNLTNVAWGDPNPNQSGIFLKPLAGYVVTLLGADIGSWLSVSRTSEINIFDGLGNLLFHDGPFSVSAIARHYDFDLTSATGIKVQWGPEAFNVGIDNVAFRVSAVPGPVAGAGLPVLALAAFGLWRRRKTA